MSQGWLENRNVLLFAPLVLAVGIVLGGFVLGDGIRRMNHAERSVTMRGLSERDVTADLATWTIAFTESGSQLDTVQREIERDTRTLTDFFRENGFAADQLADVGSSVTSFYDNQREEKVVTVRRRMQLRTNDIARARRAYARQFDLIRGGIAIEEGSGMVYSFTKLNDIKPAMIAEATQDARRGAQQFAQDSGTEVGGIRSATQGYFSITARDGSDYEGSGQDSPFQKVRVVTTIEFYLD